MKWMKRRIIFVLMIVFFVSLINVSATNGCNMGDVECEGVPTNNCDVTNDTVFDAGTYNLSDGVDICADDVVLDCGGATLIGDYPDSYKAGISSGYNYVTIRNCIVEDYGVGISIGFLNTVVDNLVIDNSNGIRVGGANNTVVNNVAFSNTAGIQLPNSNARYNVIMHNFLDKNAMGMWILNGGANNIIEENDFGYCGFDGCIRMTGADYNTIINNNLTETNGGVDFRIESGSSFNLIEGNLLATGGNPAAIFFEEAFSNVVSNNVISNSGNGIALYYSENNTIIGNDISEVLQTFSGGKGLTLFSSHNNVIRGNDLTEANRSIVLFSSDYNVIESNEIMDNLKGMEFDDSNNNLIYNNFFNNSFNVFGDEGINYWNATKDCSQENIIGGPCIGGNSWNDYLGVDLDGDGLGDTNLPYNSNSDIVNGGDYLPLVEPSEGCVGDVDGNGVVDVRDLVLVILHWHEEEPDISLPGADVNGDGIVNTEDLVIVILNWGVCGSQEASWNGDISGKVEREIRERLGEEVLNEVEMELGVISRNERK